MTDATPPQLGERVTFIMGEDSTHLTAIGVKPVSGAAAPAPDAAAGTAASADGSAPKPVYQGEVARDCLPASVYHSGAGRGASPGLIKVTAVPEGVESELNVGDTIQFEYKNVVKDPVRRGRGALQASCGGW